MRRVELSELSGQRDVKIQKSRLKYIIICSQTTQQIKSFKS